MKRNFKSVGLKTLVTLVAILLFACGGGGVGGDNGGVGPSGGTYSNSTLSGVWMLIVPEDDENMFLIADGNGHITDMGMFGVADPPGTYAVTVNGALTITLWGRDPDDSDIVIQAQLDSQTHATGKYETINLEFTKVSDISAAEGTWHGTLAESAAPNTVHSIVFEIDAHGDIISFSGFAGPVTGKMYVLSNGAAAAFFWTGEVPYPYNMFRISGDLTAPDTFTGTFGLDNGAPDNDGAAILTRGGVGPNPSGVSADDFVGTWDGAFTFEGSQIPTVITFDQNLAGLFVLTMNGGPITHDNFVGTFSNSVLSFDLPVANEDEGDPDCDNWDFSCEATLSTDLSTMTFDCEGVVCGSGGGSPLSISGTATNR